VAEAEAGEDGAEALASEPEDEWPVHRPLIRAQLPRPEGHVPERKPTDFTIRQTGGHFEGERSGNRARGKGHHKQAQGQGQSRFANSRSGSGQQSRHGGGQHTGDSQRHGNRQGPPSGQRGRPGHGGGQGRGPKRGR
jgi:hypothetical protein